MLRKSLLASCVSLCATLVTHGGPRSLLPMIDYGSHFPVSHGIYGGPRRLLSIINGSQHALATTSPSARTGLVKATSAPPGREPLEEDEELIEEDNISNARLIFEILRRRLPSLVKPNFAKARLAFSSVVTQVGAQAFLFVSSILAVAAVFIEQVARRLRRFDASGAAWVWLIGPTRLQDFMERRQAQIRSAIGRLKYETMAEEVCVVRQASIRLARRSKCQPSGPLVSHVPVRLRPLCNFALPRSFSMRSPISTRMAELTAQSSTVSASASTSL